MHVKDIGDNQLSKSKVCIFKVSEKQKIINDQDHYLCEVCNSPLVCMGFLWLKKITFISIFNIESVLVSI